MKRRNRKKKKIETSKLILIFCDVLTMAVTCSTIVLTLKTCDVTPLELLIPSAFGLSATCHSFYFWKSKAENLHKYGRDQEITSDDITDSNGG